MTQMTDLVDKDSGRVITTVFHMFWKLENIDHATERCGDYKKGDSQTSGRENSHVQMKNTLGGINGVRQCRRDQ